MVWKRLLLLPVALAVMSATTPVDPRTISDAWPPPRYTTDTALRVIFATSLAEIAEICGPAPEGKIKGGCAGHDAFGTIIVVPHPALVDPSDFRLIVAHELAHANGWPETHDK